MDLEKCHENKLFFNRFSFFDSKATQYIGEICRYLLASKEVAEESQHKVRIMFGNGLRPQIWNKFVQRFNIPNIAEFCEHLHFSKLILHL